MIQAPATDRERWAAARERARRQGVRLHVVTPQLRYWSPSQSRDDVVYQLRFTSSTWTCDCPGFVYSGVCKHLAALDRRAAAEGWGPIVDES